ncbi:hypothetical protein GCM10027059_12450 [Myceligenerans halotolerans]
MSTNIPTPGQTVKFLDVPPAGEMWAGPGDAGVFVGLHKPDGAALVALEGRSTVQIALDQIAPVPDKVDPDDGDVVDELRVTR